MRNILYFLSVVIFLTACSGSKNVSRINTQHGFTALEMSIILEKDSLTPMRVFKTVNPTDLQLLKSKSTDFEADPDDPTLRHFISRLYHTVQDSASRGVGIAAPQVGILKNIIWVQRFDKENKPFEVYLNPRIIQYSTLKQECREGCLSIPDRMDTLNVRSYAILLEYEKMDRTRHIEMIEDFTAVIFQHEIDHLNGILYTDRLE